MIEDHNEKQASRISSKARDLDEDEELERLKRKKKKKLGELEVDDSDIPVHEKFVKEEHVKR